MNPNNTPFTAFYAQWLESFRAMIPGYKASGPSEELTPKQEQVAATQEWEDEGGSIKPPAEAKPALASVPKIPF
jgi:hypothetical protein